ncbi:MAG: LacI family DNA-binding transcriptional regulator [Armatimonadota bacterium]|nr:LacI family DNA-binding transcriptional regulator [Armatimonadota bacterium]MDR7485981.1 LacI family DNA-binding transcriptional regulator [Armatimonadota bacterium]MDR7534340.1 LacI family DNA-binding transcriptional regulator [Armatimonadota bacterium]MDR7536900.1 LacI family DNA-binding transcriptional regulator [Armatimonadota bacterium]
MTIHDVARRAGVSPATVSRVLNNSGHPVSPRARARVERTARTLGYVPNRLARSLLTRETAAIGLLVPDVSNPYYAVVLRGIEDAASQAGRAVILCNTDRRQDKQQVYLRTLLERRVDGLIVAGGTVTAADLRLVRGLVPMVAIGRHQVPLPTVRVDNVAAGETAARHLLALGHRRIACLAGPAASRTVRDRTTGVARALRAAGVALADQDVVATDFTGPGGYAAARRLLQRASPPSALIAFSDQVAIGALRALHDLGVAVPARVSVVAFDDTPLAAFVIPSLTAISVPMYDLGRRAAALLLALLAGQPAASVVLPTQLHVRESTGPAPGHRE